MNLVELHLQNNRLKSLPLTLVSLSKSLEVVNVANNPELSTMIPNKVAENAKVIMWIIIHLSEHSSLSDHITKSSMEMSSLAERNKEKNQQLQNQIDALHQQEHFYNEENESIKYFLRMREKYRRIRKWFKEFNDFRKAMLSKELRKSFST
jgi:uncharacterized membrane protein YgaE (UPF0421/DUF939 family)